jgi:DUF1680 family protein
MEISAHYKIGLILGLGLMFNLPDYARSQEQTMSLFKPQQVKLLPGVFKEAEQTDLKYILALDADRLLAPYLKEAGLKTKASNYPNWESTGLDGHMGGHYLSALSLMYAATGDKRIGDKIQYVLATLKGCQDANKNGYLGGVPGGAAMWTEIASGNIKAGSFDLNKKWVPLYNIHKIFAGLRDAWLYTDNALAKTMLIDFSNWFVWLTARLTDQQIQKMLISEHGGLNEVFADVYAITKDKRMLKLAYQFSDQRILNPLINQEDKLNGLHANTQIPKVIGFERIAMLNHDKDYQQAAHFFWQTVVNHRTTAIGGNSVREHFNPSDDFSTMISSVEGPETCNSYNMLKLSKLLYETEGTANYVDYYERTLYNHILSSQNPKGGFVYFTPMRPNHYRVYSQPQTSFWCCVGSGIENHAKYNELIYAHQANQLFVNLFIPSTLDWKAKGVKITQTTLFPESEETNLLINTKKLLQLAINIRKPSWVTADGLRVLVNNKLISVSQSVDGYLKISRLWKDGDQVKVILPMNIKLEQMPDKSAYYAVLKGPIVLAAKTGNNDLAGLYADDSRMGHIAKGKQYDLQDTPIFIGDENTIPNQITRISGKQSVYSMANFIYPQSKSTLELIPFYKIHDSRYLIYWPVSSEKGLDDLKRHLAADENEKLKLAANTVDVVFPGEQQPEVDHQFKSDQSNSGTFKNKHWRNSNTWFSYELSNRENLATAVQITYYGKETGRSFKLLVNGKVIAEVKLTTDLGDVFYTQKYPIAKELLAPGKTLNIKFEADKDKETASIYEVRLIK